MSNIDEKIAKLKMQQRIENEKKLNNELNQDTVDTGKEKVNLEEVINQMKAGVVTLEERNFKFKKISFLDGKIELPIPLAFFEEKINNASNITLINDLYGISFNCAYVMEGAVKQTFKQFKEGMEKGFKEMNLYLEWLEEGEIGEKSSKVFYGTYKTPTSKGDMYNLIFYREHNGTLIIGNYNCFYKDIEIWEYLIKASIMLMKVN
ncbi:hypothetical protein [uncultured Clostridium sp.]|uniref:hypothetical protein n=1 Tax=uncultured Clostridium sp. TaxID=59620 RepID=UPI0028EAD15A|nr:hypothetical protein [uncultured Clostridium sp.]